MNEEELLELLMGFLPETWEGWLCAALGICALLALILPQPAEDCHPALKIAHRLICILGMGASRLRASGKGLATLFRRGK